MKNLKIAVMCLVVAMISLIAFVKPQSAYAVGTAIGAQGTVQDRVMPIDGNGQTLMLPDVGYKVWEVMNTATASQVLDEKGKQPTNGLLHAICVESGTSGSAHQEYVLYFDTASISGLAATTTGRRLGPPIQRATLTERCVTIDAQFTSGLAILNSSALYSTHVYWRPNGGRN